MSTFFEPTKDTVVCGAILGASFLLKGDIPPEYSTAAFHLSAFSFSKDISLFDIIQLLLVISFYPASFKMVSHGVDEGNLYDWIFRRDVRRGKKVYYVLVKDKDYPTILPSSIGRVLLENDEVEPLKKKLLKEMQPNFSKWHTITLKTCEDEHVTAPSKDVFLFWVHYHPNCKLYFEIQTTLGEDRLQELREAAAKKHDSVISLLTDEEQKALCQ